MRKTFLLFSLFLLVSGCATSGSGHVSVRSEPHSAASDYYYMLGYEAFMEGRWDDTLMHYEMALQADPGSAYLRVQLGHLLYRRGDVTGGLKLALEVAAEHPDDVKALMLIADIYVSQKRMADAVPVMSRLRRLANDNNEVLQLLGKLYYGVEMPEEALETLTRAIEKDPEDYISLDYLSAISIDRKEYAKAEQYLKRELALKPLESVYFKLGVVHELQEKFPEAVEAYEKVLELNQENAQARERIAQIYIRQKAFGKAIDEFQQLSRLQPENADMHVRLGMLYYEAKDFERSLDEFGLALVSKPDTAGILYYRALVLEEMERLEEAASDFKKIIRKEPKNINAFLHLAVIYSRQKKEDEAIRVFEEILEFEKDKQEIYLSLSLAYMRIKDYGRAEKMLQEALIRFSDQHELYFNLAMVYDKAGKDDEMVAALKKTIGLNPEHADALNYLGYYYADKNMHLDESLSLLEKAVSLKPENGYIRDSYGWVLYRLGRFSSAIEQLEKALTTVSDDPLLFEHLGDSYLAVKKTEKAIENWRRALINPDKEEGLKERVEKKILEHSGSR